MPLRINAISRRRIAPPRRLILETGVIAVPDPASARLLSARSGIPAGDIRAMSLIDQAHRRIMQRYRELAESTLEGLFGHVVTDPSEVREYRRLLIELVHEFPPPSVSSGMTDAENWLDSEVPAGKVSMPAREAMLEEYLLLKLNNENPACTAYRALFDDGIRDDHVLPGSLADRTAYARLFTKLEQALVLPLKVVETDRAVFGEDVASLIAILRQPYLHAPASLEAQLRWIAEHWGEFLGDFRQELLSGLDLLAEEHAPRFGGGPGPAQPYTYHSLRHEYERFSPDRSWMPSLVLLAKNALVWLHQLSRLYGRPIQRLDEIPEEELQTIAHRGITGLWLIGIWQRSPASERIKKLCGNPDAAASAYSLFDYEISPEIGGWEALDRLRERCRQYGIRLAADMVPNHTGIDAKWVREHPEYFISAKECPFPSYTFNGPDLSSDPSIGIWIEDHYYDRTDAAVVFKRLDRNTGEVRYIYHGNDGTSMPWNDTAQIDFLNPAAREAVKERILHVAQHFSIIRFDAAMVLARQHIRRLWYPAPGSGGAIPSRSDWAMSDEAFDKAMPNEFWREVVDLCAAKAPDTLLLAEAFWLMEGYFVRTLGMHRVYNSAFMNMLKEEKNSLYRLTIKNTQEFDRQILKRFVNFLSNPDEDTAIAQFGRGDKYFGVCTLMATMPGLPMLAHGQIEGFTEKYGMEFKKAYRDEWPDQDLVARHEREIFPLLRMRYLFADVEHFYLFDCWKPHGTVDENVFAYTNGTGNARALVLYNNCWERTSGRIHMSCPFATKTADGSKRMERVTLAQALGIDPSPQSYVVMHEMRSGLWYVYRSMDLATHGFEVALEGYQNKVYIDISCVHDTEGRYARLHDIIGRRGVADLDDALLEADRPDLFRALHNAISSMEVMFSSSLFGFSRKDAVERAAIFVEMFLSRLCEALCREETARPASKAGTIGKSARLLGHVLARVDEMPQAISRIHGGETIEELPRARLALIILIFTRAMAEALQESAGTENIRMLLDEYLISKKLREFASSALQALPPRESPVEETLSFVDGAALADIASGLALIWDAKTLGNASPATITGSLLHAAMQDPMLRETLGINSYRGVEYCNKERLEALLSMIPCAAWVERAAEGKLEAFETEAELWKEAVTYCRDAARQAGYRTEILLSLVAQQS
ncbi:MAG: alpha-amylase family glycosyl hydrolase [Spirochaetaceae bacterium]|nr:alpha-amylase family glycosyl hydrolase [Spirochaetaceae bacterium]